MDNTKVLSIDRKEMALAFGNDGSVKHCIGYLQQKDSRHRLLKVMHVVTVVYSLLL